jgi:hypothetical protein
MTKLACFVVVFFLFKLFNIKLVSSHEKIMMSLPGSQAVNHAYRRVEGEELSGKGT